jgi:enterochelin esterase family protein
MRFGLAAPRAAGARGDAAGKQDAARRFHEDSLEMCLPLVDAKFPRLTDRDHRAIAGLSLGGAQALAIGLTHIDLFSRIAAFSPPRWVLRTSATGVWDFETVLSDTSKINNQINFLWVSCGTEDTLFDSIRDFSLQLAKHKIEHIYRITGGAHAYPVWQRNLNEVAPLLFRIETEVRKPFMLSCSVPVFSVLPR